MGPIQLLLVITGVMIIHNHLWEKEKKIPVRHTIFQIIAIVAIILLLEHFIPFLK